MTEQTKQKISVSLRGKPLSPTHRKKISDGNKGKHNKVLSEETKQKISISHIGHHYNKGIKFSKKARENMALAHIGKSKGPHSEDHKTKIRLSLIKTIENRKLNGNQIIPSYNKYACKIIEEYGKQNGYNFQHAENGGEYRIKELGYWVDGYDKDKNIVIEYYENKHKQNVDKDEIRKNQIINLLGCKFIEIKQWEI